MHVSQQSPVDITGYIKGGAPSVRFAYNLACNGAASHITNTGEFVKVIYEDAGGILVDGREYRLAEAHMHSPAEHTVDDERFALETHLVHTSESGGIAVVGITYRLGEANLVIQAIIDSAPAQGEDGMKLLSPLTGDAYLPKGRGFYAYTGSLTTPPYTEGVQWLVLSDALEVSEAQVRQLTALTGGKPNSREVQPLNGRTITAH